MSIFKSSTKIISTLLVFTFLLTNSGYSLSLSSKTTLRPQLLSVTKDGLKPVVQIVSNAKAIEVLTEINKTWNNIATTLKDKKNLVTPETISAFNKELDKAITGLNELSAVLSGNQYVDLLQEIDFNARLSKVFMGIDEEIRKRKVTGKEERSKVVAMGALINSLSEKCDSDDDKALLAACVFYAVAISTVKGELLYLSAILSKKAEDDEAELREDIAENAASFKDGFESLITALKESEKPSIVSNQGTSLNKLKLNKSGRTGS
ncbi:MAG: hypothetical protein KKD11_02460 [Candidatus Omnitrophica bacterium]|nr:hypothetical protein [Candidatus Omnitrophota bacterium]